jgi:hypothetical protein
MEGVQRDVRKESMQIGEVLQMSGADNELVAETRKGVLCSNLGGGDPPDSVTC